MSRKSKQATREQRRAKVAALLTASVPYRKMAESLGVSIGTIARDVNILLMQWAKEQDTEDTRRWRILEAAKLEELEFAVKHDALRGNHNAVDRVLRIMERRARLLGLDMPVKADVTSGGQPLTVKIVGLDPDGTTGAENG